MLSLIELKTARIELEQPASVWCLIVIRGAFHFLTPTNHFPLSLCELFIFDSSKTGASC